MSAGDDDSPYNDYIEDPSQSKKGEKTFVVISDHPSPRVSNVLKNNSNNDDSPTLAVSSASVSTGNRDTNADENNNTNSAAEISELADEEDEDMAFVNSLNDDVEEGEKFDMIAEVAKIGGKLWAEFSQEELKMLSKALAVLSFENDEKIIMKDEEATFCGIVLDGVVGAVINDRLTIPLDKGNVIGEMSYFEGGSRSCDMVTLSPCYLGVIKFEEVEGLAQVNETLFSKWTRLLARSSLIKLRKRLHQYEPQGRDKLLLSDDEDATLKNANKDSENKDGDKKEKTDGGAGDGGSDEPDAASTEEQRGTSASSGKFKSKKGAQNQRPSKSEALYRNRDKGSRSTIKARNKGGLSDKEAGLSHSVRSMRMLLHRKEADEKNLKRELAARQKETQRLQDELKNLKTQKLMLNKLSSSHAQKIRVLAQDNKVLKKKISVDVKALQDKLEGKREELELLTQQHQSALERTRALTREKDSLSKELSELQSNSAIQLHKIFRYKGEMAKADDEKRKMGERMGQLVEDLVDRDKTLKNKDHVIEKASLRSHVLADKYTDSEYKISCYRTIVKFVSIKRYVRYYLDKKNMSGLLMEMCQLRDLFITFVMRNNEITTSEQPGIAEGLRGETVEERIIRSRRDISTFLLTKPNSALIIEKTISVMEGISELAHKSMKIAKSRENEMRLMFDRNMQLVQDMVNVKALKEKAEKKHAKLHASRTDQSKAMQLMLREKKKLETHIRLLTKQVESEQRTKKRLSNKLIQESISGGGSQSPARNFFTAHPSTHPYRQKQEAGNHSARQLHTIHTPHANANTNANGHRPQHRPASSPHSSFMQPHEQHGQSLYGNADAGYASSTPTPIPTNTNTNTNTTAWDHQQQHLMQQRFMQQQQQQYQHTLTHTQAHAHTHPSTPHATPTANLGHGFSNAGEEGTCSSDKQRRMVVVLPGPSSSSAASMSPASASPDTRGPDAKVISGAHKGKASDSHQTDGNHSKRSMPTSPYSGNGSVSEREERRRVGFNLGRQSPYHSPSAPAPHTTRSPKSSAKKKKKKKKKKSKGSDKKEREREAGAEEERKAAERLAEAEALKTTPHPSSPPAVSKEHDRADKNGQTSEEETVVIDHGVQHSEKGKGAEEGQMVVHHHYHHHHHIHDPNASPKSVGKGPSSSSSSSSLPPSLKLDRRDKHKKNSGKKRRVKSARSRSPVSAAATSLHAPSTLAQTRPHSSQSSSPVDYRNHIQQQRLYQHPRGHLDPTLAAQNSSSVPAPAMQSLHQLPQESFPTHPGTTDLLHQHQHQHQHPQAQAQAQAQVQAHFQIDTGTGHNPLHSYNDSTHSTSSSKHSGDKIKSRGKKGAADSVYTNSTNHHNMSSNTDMYRSHINSSLKKKKKKKGKSKHRVSSFAYDHHAHLRSQLIKMAMHGSGQTRKPNKGKHNAKSSDSNSSNSNSSSSKSSGTVEGQQGGITSSSSANLRGGANKIKLHPIVHPSASSSSPNLHLAASEGSTPSSSSSTALGQRKSSTKKKKRKGPKKKATRYNSLMQQYYQTTGNTNM